MDIVSILAIICLFIGAPTIVFGFIYLNKRNQRDVEIMRYKKEMLELEVEKEALHLKMIEAENTKYDRLIDDRGR